MGYFGLAVDFGPHCMPVISIAALAAALAAANAAPNAAYVPACCCCYHGTTAKSRLLGCKKK